MDVINRAHSSLKPCFLWILRLAVAFHIIQPGPVLICMHTIEEAENPHTSLETVDCSVMTTWWFGKRARLAPRISPNIVNHCRGVQFHWEVQSYIYIHIHIYIYIWLYGYMVIWLYGYMVIWFIALWCYIVMLEVTFVDAIRGSQPTEVTSPLWNTPMSRYASPAGPFGGFLKWRYPVPPNGWFTMGNPIRIDDLWVLWVPPFQETSI